MWSWTSRRATTLDPWARAGATWIVTDFGMQPTEAEVREVIDAGPGSDLRIEAAIKPARGTTSSCAASSGFPASQRRAGYVRQSQTA